MLEINNKASYITQYTLPILLPSTIDDPSFLGVYASTSALPSNPTPFSTAGIAGTGSMYGFVNGSWIYLGQYLYDAYRYLVYYNGSSFQSVSGSKWTSVFNDIASNQPLMTEFAGSNTAMTNIIASNTALNAVAASSTAMTAVAASSTAMSAIAASSTAMTAVGNSTTAMNAILPNSTYKEIWWASSYAVGLGLNTYTALNNSTLAGLATVSAIAGNSTAMSAIAGSSTAMNAVATSSTAMTAVATSSTAMTAVAASSTAMTAVAASSTAMTAVAASSTAMTAVGNSTTAMSAILPTSSYKETWWGSSYAVGLGLNTYAALNNSTLAGLATVSAIAGNSTAMSAITGSSTAMTAVVASSTAMTAMAASSTAMNAIIASSPALNTMVSSSTAMTAVAASSTAMNAIISSYTAINAMTRLTVLNAIKSSSVAATAVGTLISNIISGSMTLGGGTTGSSSAIGLNGLLTLLTANNGSAVTGLSTANAITLSQKIDSAFSSLETTYSIPNSTSNTALTLATNQIVYVTKLTCTSTNGSTISVSNNSNVIDYFTDATGTVWSPHYALVITGAVNTYSAGSTGSAYWVTYTPS